MAARHARCPVIETVGDLIGRAAVAARHAEEFFHFADPEIGHAPGANFSLCLQAFKCRDDVGDTDGLLRPVQEVKIEMVGAEPLEARLAGARDAIARHMVRPHLRNQEDLIALAGNRAADEFLGAVHFRRIDKRHSGGDARAQCLLLRRPEGVFPLRDGRSPGPGPARSCHREISRFALPLARFRRADGCKGQRE